MLMKLSAFVAALVLIARAQEDDDDHDHEHFVPKMCEFSFDYFLAVSSGLGLYAVTDKCSYFDVADDEDGDYMVSWTYTCNGGGDMVMTVFYDQLICSGGNYTDMTIYEADSDADGLFYSCDGTQNCAVRMKITEPCVGNTDFTGEIWPAKDLCFGNENGSYFYRCEDNAEGNPTYGYVYRDNMDCSDEYNLEVEVGLFEDGCEDESDVEIKCNGASQVGFGLATFAALLFAFIR